MNPYVKMVLFGLGGGIISALIWAGIMYGTGSEIGWIAWLIGGIVGVAVRLADDEVDGNGPGLIAVCIVIPSLVGGKYLGTRFLVERALADLKIPAVVDPMFAKVELAHEVVADYERQKKRLVWPEKSRLLTSATKDAQTPEEFPADVWKETLRRWDKLAPPEQQARLQTAQSKMDAIFAQVRSQIMGQAFSASFSPFDILWFFLAIGTAYRIGARMPTD